MPPSLDSLSPAQKLVAMKSIARFKVGKASGSEKFFAKIEEHLDTIAIARLGKLAPVDENLLGYAMMLMAEVRRLRA